MYCFGDSSYGVGGWLYDGTSAGWIRQYPSGNAGRVSFDGSVDVMRSVGCGTVKAEIQPTDLSSNGGTDVQRAQLYTSDQLLAQYGNHPSLDTQAGMTTWYGFAFSTNAGYQPFSGSSFPNWNTIFTWHPGGSAGGGTGLGVWTRDYNSSNCISGLKPFADGAPHLGFSLDGGDPSVWPNSGSTCLRFAGPTFVPGHVYRVAMKVTWSSSNSGALQLWIDGTQYVDVNNVSTLFSGQGIYPLFENYRPYTTSLPTNDVFYGGLLKGASLSDVSVP